MHPGDFCKESGNIMEGLVRGFILKAGMDTTEEKLLQIVLLDMGSIDGTLKIMENLSYDYSVIELVKPDDLPVFLNNLI